jgi:hypothetical protein
MSFTWGIRLGCQIGSVGMVTYELFFPHLETGAEQLWTATLPTMVRFGDFGHVDVVGHDRSPQDGAPRAL